MIKIGDVVSLIDMNQLDILEQLQCEKDFKMTVQKVSYVNGKAECAWFTDYFLLCEKNFDIKYLKIN